MKRPTLLRTFLAPLFVASLVTAGVACSSNGASGAAAGDRESFIRQYCDQFMPCCVQAGRPSDGAQCRAFVGAFATGNYDAAAGNKCLDEVRAASGSPDFCRSGGNQPTCQKVFSGGGGSKKPGETCEQDSDCASSSEGRVDCASLYKDGATIRKCQVQVDGKLGDSPCVGTVDGNTTSYSYSSSDTDIPSKGYLCHVKDGLRCDSSTKKCAVIPKVGEKCEGSGFYSCTKDAFCDFSTKTCVARKPVGEKCDGFSSTQCIEDAYCDSTSKTCMAKLGDGTACTSNESCKSGSCVNKACAKSGGGDLGVAFLCGGG